MIDEKLTFQKFGYCSFNWGPKSSKKVIAICEGCGKIREIEKQCYVNSSLCLSCSKRGKVGPNKGRVFTETWKQNMSEARKGHVFSESHNQKCSEAFKGRVFSEEWRENLSKSKLGKKLVFSNPEERMQKILSKIQASPNNFEIKCLGYLNKIYPSKFRYVGNGEVLIGGRSCDFISEELKTVVLAHGCYWHLTKYNLEITESNKRSVEKADSLPFLEAGYKVLFVWEDELNKYCPAPA